MLQQKWPRLPAPAKTLCRTSDLESHTAPSVFSMRNFEECPFPPLRIHLYHIRISGQEPESVFLLRSRQLLPVEVKFWFRSHFGFVVKALNHCIAPERFCGQAGGLPAYIKSGLGPQSRSTEAASSGGRLTLCSQATGAGFATAEPPAAWSATVESACPAMRPRSDCGGFLGVSAGAAGSAFCGVCSRTGSPLRRRCSARGDPVHSAGRVPAGANGP